MRVLVTGAAGFIGSHVARHFVERGHDVLAVDRHCPNVAGAFDVASDLTSEFEPLLYQAGPPDVIVNLASNSHVDHSIAEPRPFIENNVAVALTMLEAARVHRPKLFLQFSTDEVYGPAPTGHEHDEWSPIIPSNPYAASKAAQEAIAISYWRTYGVPLVLTQTMNVYGPGQSSEKFVPLIVERLWAGEHVPVHAERRENESPSWRAGSRQWLYVEEVAEALEHIILRLGVPRYPNADRPARWNIVGAEEVANDEMVRLVAAELGMPALISYVDFHSTRPGHDRRYALDGSKLAAAGWAPKIGIREGLRRTLGARIGGGV